jgi:hypothetical protein
MHNRHNFGIGHLLIEGNVLTAGTSNYCRGLAIGGWETCRYNVVRRNYVHDVNIQSQFGGESTYVYSNVFVNTNVSPVNRAAQAMGTYAHNTRDATRFVQKHLLLVNNTIVNADAALMQTSFAADTTVVYDNQFTNNLVVGWRTVPWDKSRPERNTAIISDSLRKGAWVFKHNGFWKSATDTVLLTIGRRRALHVYGPALLNARAGSSANVVAAPVFAEGDSTARYELTAASPYRTSGMSLAGILPAGLEATDYNGRPYGAAASVGAFQYQPVGLDSVSVPGTPGRR